MVLAAIFFQSQPLGLLFMGVSERQVIQKQPPHSCELKEAISTVVIRITAHTLSRAVANFQCQPQTVLAAGGSYTEHVLH